MKESKPHIGVMPGFVIMEKYKGFKMLNAVLGHYDYDLGRLREQMWFYYRWAIVQSAKEDDPESRRELTQLFLTMNQLTTAAYLICKMRGKIKENGIDVEANYFPAWQPFTGRPMEIIADTFTRSSLDKYRSGLWKMVTFALQNIYSYDDKDQMDDLFFLFERLNDLFTACYHIYKKRRKNAKS